MKRCFIALAVALAIRPTSAQAPVSMNWYKGNLHTHTINSDGDSVPHEVVAWYKRHGYHFLSITDHNTFTDPATLDTNGSDEFLLIGGVEVTNDRAVHVNGIGVTRGIGAQRGASITELLQASVDAIRAQSALALVNHPNLRWAVTAKEMLPVRGAILLEISSGITGSNHYGDGRTPSTEEMWDELLSSGVRIFAVAVDDAHTFRGEFGLDEASPGRCWIVVRAPSLTREGVLQALNSGDFYASSGVELTNVFATAGSLTVQMQPSIIGPRAANETRYRVVFIGKQGRVLAISNDNPAVYKFSGTEGYVRARVEDSRGRRAWTQPVFFPATQ